MGSKQDDWTEGKQRAEDCPLIKGLNFPKFKLWDSLTELTPASVHTYSAFLTNALLASLPSTSYDDFFFSRQTRTRDPNSSQWPSG